MKRIHIAPIIISALLTILIGMQVEQRMTMNERMEKIEAEAKETRLAISDIRDRYNLIIINSAEIQNLERRIDKFEAKLDKLLER